MKAHQAEATFTELKDKRLLKATPIERKRLIFADNSYHVQEGGLGVSLTNSKLPIFILGWIESFSRLQSLQVFFKFEVTNVNIESLSVRPRLSTKLKYCENLFILHL